MDELHHPVPGRLIERRRLLAQRVHASMDVGVMVPLVVADRRYDGFRLLRRCAVVEIGERFTVNQSREHRKVLTDGSHVKLNFFL